MSKQKQWDEFKNKMSRKRMGKKEGKDSIEYLTVQRLSASVGPKIYKNWAIDNQWSLSHMRIRQWKTSNKHVRIILILMKVINVTFLLGKEGHLTLV